MSNSIVTHTPAPGFTGADAFEYSPSDGRMTNQPAQGARIAFAHLSMKDREQPDSRSKVASGLVTTHVHDAASDRLVPGERPVPTLVYHGAGTEKTVPRRPK